jgi:hypothetical protein
MTRAATRSPTKSRSGSINPSRSAVFLLPRCSGRAKSGVPLNSSIGGTSTGTAGQLRSILYTLSHFSQGSEDGEAWNVGALLESAEVTMVPPFNLFAADVTRVSSRTRRQASPFRGGTR